MLRKRKWVQYRIDGSASIIAIVNELTNFVKFIKHGLGNPTKNKYRTFSICLCSPSHLLCSRHYEQRWTSTNCVHIPRRLHPAIASYTWEAQNRLRLRWVINVRKRFEHSRRVVSSLRSLRDQQLRLRIISSRSPQSITVRCSQKENFRSIFTLYQFFNLVIHDLPNSWIGKLVGSS